MSDTRPAVEVVGLRKSFGPHVVLDGLDLRVEPGQVAGFMGPNGSGRSTTFRILLGMLRAEATSMQVLGGDPWTDAVALHRRIAYVPGEVNLWPNLTGGQAIAILCKLRGGVNRARRDALLQLFELDPTKKARAYSQGNRQKVALISALASDAELLILDEPTLGFDPLLESAFRTCILEAKAQGRSVLLASHSFAEVESLCDTVTFIRRGRTVESGRLDGLPRLHHTTISVVVDDPKTNLTYMPGVSDLVIDGQRATLTVADADLAAVMASLALLRPRELTAARPSLEELFLRHYRTEPAADRAVLP